MPEQTNPPATVTTDTTTSQQIVTKSNAENTIKSVESSIGSVSVRGILALMLVAAVIIYPFCSINIPEVVSNLAIAAVSYYYGKQQSK